MNTRNFIILILSYCSLISQLKGQELMTIGEVFDFEIGDEFQLKGIVDWQPPNADRIKIVGKYYSITEDTLYYIRFHDCYQVYIVYNQGLYDFWTETDTIFYYNLDSSMYYFNEGFQFDTSIYNSNAYCDSLINGCSFTLGEGYPYYSSNYGRGLGCVGASVFEDGGTSNGFCYVLL